MIRLRRWFRGNRAPFTELETIILEAVRANLASSAAEILGVQLRSVNLVQRHLDGKEVNLYPMMGGKVFHDPKCAFPLKQPETKLATVRVSTDQGRSPLSADVYLVEGHLFQLRFSRSPKVIRKDVEVIGVQIHVDPLLEQEKPSRREPADDMQTERSGRMPHWLAQLRIDACSPPLSRQELKDAVKRLDVPLPSDYVEFLEHCDGADLPNGSLFGIGDIYTTVVEEGEILVLAELHEAGVIALSKSAPYPDLHFYFYSGADALPLGKSFRVAILDVFGRAQ